MAITYEDIFPKTQPKEDKYHDMFPTQVQDFYKQLKTQNQMAHAARILMDTIRAMEEMNLNDDQRRARLRVEKMQKRRFSSAVKKNNDNDDQK